MVLYQCLKRKKMKVLYWIGQIQKNIFVYIVILIWKLPGFQVHTRTIFWVKYFSLKASWWWSSFENDSFMWIFFLYFTLKWIHILKDCVWKFKDNEFTCWNLCMVFHFLLLTHTTDWAKITTGLLFHEFDCRNTVWDCFVSSTNPLQYLGDNLGVACV